MRSEAVHKYRSFRSKRDETVEANFFKKDCDHQSGGQQAKRSVNDTLTERIRRLSVSLTWQRKGTRKTRQRNLGE